MHNSSATGTNTTEQGVPKVLTAIISPPIFVDSRKSARDSNIVFVSIILQKIVIFLQLIRCWLDKKDELIHRTIQPRYIPQVIH